MVLLNDRFYQVFGPFLAWLAAKAPSIAYWSLIIIVPFPLWTIAKIVERPRRALNSLLWGLFICVGLLWTLYTTLIPWFFVGLLFFWFGPWILFFGIPVTTWMLLAMAWETVRGDGEQMWFRPAAPWKSYH
jgi:hypothetical protein